MTDPTDAYENRKYIPGAAGFPPRWATAAAAFRAGLGERAECGIAYGGNARQRLDLFHPSGAPHGLMVFVHGGYWKAFDRSDWSHLAAGAVMRGWAVAMPSYRLAPEVRITAITRDVATAIRAAAERVAGPLVVTGHSAGGQLSARMRCTDVRLGPAGGRLARVVPISPLAELAPLMQTAMNATLGIDTTEAEAESPARHTALRAAHTEVWVGGDERPAFLDQACWLAKAWAVPLTVVPGRHHFDVIEELEVPRSALVNTLVGDV